MGTAIAIVLIIVVAATFALGAEAVSSIKSDFTNYEELFKLVNGAVIIAIMGVTTTFRAVGGKRLARWVPLVPMILGGLAGLLVTHDAMPMRQVLTWALLYSGASSIGYMFVWKTIMNKGMSNDE